MSFCFYPSRIISKCEFILVPRPSYFLIKKSYHTIFKMYIKNSYFGLSSPPHGHLQNQRVQQINLFVYLFY